MPKKNCDNINPDLRLTAGKHGNRLTAYREHLANMPLIIFFADHDTNGGLRTRTAIAWQMSDADLRDN